MVSIRPRHMSAVSSSTRKPVETTLSRPSPTTRSLGMIIGLSDPSTCWRLHPIGDAEQARNREAPDVGVEHPDGVPGRRQRGGEVDGDRALADATLAAGDGEHPARQPAPRCRGRSGGRSTAPWSSLRLRSSAFISPHEIFTAVTPGCTETRVSTSFLISARSGQPPIVSLMPTVTSPSRQRRRPTAPSRATRCRRRVRDR